MSVSPARSSTLPLPRSQSAHGISWRKPVPTFLLPQESLPPLDFGERASPHEAPQSRTDRDVVDGVPQQANGAETQLSLEEHWEDAVRKLHEYHMHPESSPTPTRRLSLPFPHLVPLDRSVSPEEEHPSQHAPVPAPAASRQPSAPQDALGTFEASPTSTTATTITPHAPSAPRRKRSSTRPLRKPSSANTYRPPTPPRSYAVPQALTLSASIDSASQDVSAPPSAFNASAFASEELLAVPTHGMAMSRKSSVARTLYDHSATVTARPSFQSLHSAQTIASRNTDSWFLPQKLHVQWPYLREGEDAGEDTDAEARRAYYEERMNGGPRNLKAGYPAACIDIVPTDAATAPAGGGFNPMHVVALDRLKHKKRRACDEACWDTLVGAARRLASWFKAKPALATAGGANDLDRVPV